ncbi:MAG: GDP-mannose 4,6-dehydratase [Clostridiales bacterium]|nr:GDP-mannose 4,6-dehydratase [Clostridiales bacterium]
MRQILVTGGAGFIGSHFINHILSEKPEIKVVNFDALTYAADCSNIKANDRYTFIKGSITNDDELAILFNDYHFDAIINFAAETHVDRSIQNGFVFTETNILGLHKLIQKSMDNNVNKFIQISTDEVYGANNSEIPFEETSPVNPENPYSASKAGADLLIAAFNNTFGYKVIIIRSSNNYGEKQYPEKLIPISIKRLIEGKKIELYGDGKQKRDWLSVHDNVKIISSILFDGNNGEIYNICSGIEKENRDIARAIINAINILIGTKYCEENDIQYVEDRKGHDYKYTMSNRKIMKEFDIKNFRNFEEEILEVTRHYLKEFEVIK